jgi:hypothetical protein
LVDVDPKQASAVAVGDVLRVTLFEDRYPIVERNGGRLGSVTSGQPGTLAKCLREDGPFEAEILKVDGGWIEVLVRHS